MGWATLLLFPIPAFMILSLVEGTTIVEFLACDSIRFSTLLMGCIVGFIYAMIANSILKIKIFETIPLRVDEVVRSMNLSIVDALFLSLCAGIGEELLFRAGIQFFLGPIATSILFIALHGYLNPLNWRQSLYGFVALPLSFILGYGYEWYGLWFSISVHFMYDFVLFLSMSKNRDARSFS